MLDIAKANRALMEVARREGIPVERVVEEIRNTIDDALKRCKENDNQKALELWARIPCVGEVPTPQELVAYLGDNMFEEQETLSDDIFLTTCLS